MRKFLRSQILPPLKDVHSRPEQGNTLRNHLCRLLTRPVTQLRDLVAELIFILCKKNGISLILFLFLRNKDTENILFTELQFCLCTYYILTAIHLHY